MRAPIPVQRIFNFRDTVSLEEHDPWFARGWELIREELTEWRDSSEMWDYEAERCSRRRTASLERVGVVAAVIGGLGLFFTADVSRWLTVLVAAASSVLIGMAVAAVLNHRELPVRTPDGYAKRQWVEGFRRSFMWANGRYVKELAERGDLPLYAAWAVALGELDSWASATEDVVLEPGVPAWVDPAAFTQFTAATTVASAPPVGPTGDEEVRFSNFGGIG